MGSLGVLRSRTALGRMCSLSLAISSRLMECSAALLNSRLHATARPSRVLYPPRSLKLGTDSKSMCLGYDRFICAPFWRRRNPACRVSGWESRPHKGRVADDHLLSTLAGLLLDPRSY